MNNLKNNMHYCEHCKKLVHYDIENKMMSNDIVGENISFLGKVMICKECKKEMCSFKIEHFNMEIMMDTYRFIHELVSRNEVLRYVYKSNMTLDELSNVLGTVPSTLQKWIDGAIPPKHISDIIKEKLYGESRRLK